MSSSPAPEKPKAPDDPLAQIDRILERRLRDTGKLLARDPELVDRETLIWLLGAILNQRERYASLMRGAARELRDQGSDKAELITLLEQYGTIREGQ
jgi:hypothetical protein